MLCIKRPHVVGKIKLTLEFSLAKYIIHIKATWFSSFLSCTLLFPHLSVFILTMSPPFLTPIISSQFYFSLLPLLFPLQLPISSPFPPFLLFFFPPVFLSPYATFITTDTRTKERPLFSLRKRRIIENQD